MSTYYVPGTMTRLERHTANPALIEYIFWAIEMLPIYNPIKTKRKPSFEATYQGLHLVLKKDFSKQVAFEMRAEG